MKRLYFRPVDETPRAKEGQYGVFATADGLHVVTDDGAVVPMRVQPVPPALTVLPVPKVRKVRLDQKATPPPHTFGVALLDGVGYIHSQMNR